ncbi:hypothetical protein [Paenibacillus psychroresistens]|nr:hypothetical protein [Paenibacillus psychroresistens]
MKWRTVSEGSPCILGRWTIAASSVGMTIIDLQLEFSRKPGIEERPIAP